MSDDVRMTLAYEEPAPGMEACLGRTSAGVFTVDMRQPQREGLRLEVCLENGRSDRGCEVQLEVDWGSAAIASYSDILYVRGPEDEDWRQVPGSLRAKHTLTRLVLPPGRTLVGICPLYTYGQCLEFMRRLADLGDERVVTGSAGRSHEDRDIPLFEIGRPDPRPPVLIVGRCHAYETAGNYTIEGMARFLLSGHPVAEYLLERFRFHFIPMMNVDGVVRGYGRFTGVPGADLNRDFECNRNRAPGSEKDRALISHFEVLDRLQPVAYLNLHNWMNKFDDGLIGWDRQEVDTFRSFMPAQHVDYKRWKVSVACVPGSRSPGRYSRETYGTVGFVLEFPWYGRTAARMRGIGATALEALAHTALVLQKQQRKI